MVEPARSPQQSVEPKVRNLEVPDEAVTGLCHRHHICKLAFFGVGKFDPRSRLWVRNTMFQGAPLLEDIGKTFNDDWFMPLAPQQSGEQA